MTALRSLLISWITRGNGDIIEARLGEIPIPRVSEVESRSVFRPEFRKCHTAHLVLKLDPQSLKKAGTLCGVKLKGCRISLLQVLPGQASSHRRLPANLDSHVFAQEA